MLITINLMRLIIILAMIYLIVVLIKSFYRHSLGAPRKKRDHRSVARIVQCEHCGLYVPDQEAIHAGGHIYCSNEHSKAGPDQKKHAPPPSG